METIILNKYRRSLSETWRAIINEDEDSGQKFLDHFKLLDDFFDEIRSNKLSYPEKFDSYIEEFLRGHPHFKSWKKNLQAELFLAEMEKVKISLSGIPISTNTELIEKHLGCFRGTFNGCKIMSVAEYNRLKGFVLKLIENEKLPIKKKFDIELPAVFIRQTFANLHDDCKLSNKSGWAAFLKDNIKQFEKAKASTINTKFGSIYPHNYKNDKDAIKDY